MVAPGAVLHGSDANATMFKVAQRPPFGAFS